MVKARGELSRRILGKLFYYLSTLVDKKYYEYRWKSQKYEQIIGCFSRETIAILDVVENWSRGDLRERIEIKYISDFQVVANTLNEFIDNLTEELQKLPENCFLREKFQYMD